MATTSPDNLFSPNPSDNYNLIADWATSMQSVQAALVKRGNMYVGTSTQRTAFTTAPEGVHWQDTNGSKKEYVRQANAWVEWVSPPSDGLVQLYSSTGVWLNGTQSATLSAPISSQKTGIVLSWSGYSSGTAVDSNWNHVFIPKSALSLPGAGNNMLLAYGQSSGGVIGRKYVYVNDTSIAGHADNAVAPNTSFVLRAVWGC